MRRVRAELLCARVTGPAARATGEEQQAEQGELDGLCQTYDVDAAKKLMAA